MFLMRADTLRGEGGGQEASAIWAKLWIEKTNFLVDIGAEI
jgi:hypothetical protein